MGIRKNPFPHLALHYLDEYGKYRKLFVNDPPIKVCATNFNHPLKKGVAPPRLMKYLIGGAIIVFPYARKGKEKRVTKTYV